MITNFQRQQVAKLDKLRILPQGMQSLYRYDSLNNPHTVILSRRTFTLLRETVCGYWVVEFYNKYWSDGNEVNKKWVSKTARKRLCYPTKKEAMASFKIRKSRHLSILQNQLKIAELACKLDSDTDRVYKPSALCFEYE